MIKNLFTIKPPDSVISEIEKPVVHIQRLQEQMFPYSESFRVTHGELLRYQYHGKRVCYILLEGSVTLNRQGDGLVLNSEKPPFILGVSNQLSSGDNLYIRATENSHLARLPLERFNLLVEKYNLWEDLCSLLIYSASSVYAHCSAIALLSSYDVVKFQLNQLMNEPSHLRTAMTAANYIQDRTFLSRSGIMRIIAHLRDAGFITLQRGILIDINHLPDRY